MLRQGGKSLCQAELPAETELFQSPSNDVLGDVARPILIGAKAKFRMREPHDSAESLGRQANRWILTRPARKCADQAGGGRQAGSEQQRMAVLGTQDSPKPPRDRTCPDGDPGVVYISLKSHWLSEKLGSRSLVMNVLS